MVREEVIMGVIKANGVTGALGYGIVGRPWED